MPSNLAGSESLGALVDEEEEEEPPLDRLVTVLLMANTVKDHCWVSTVCTRVAMRYSSGMVQKLVRDN